jgi:hypothetical protein
MVSLAPPAKSATVILAGIQVQLPAQAVELTACRVVQVATPRGELNNWVH